MKRLFYFIVTLLLMAGFAGCMEEIKKTPVGGDEIYADNNDLELLIGQTILLTASPDNVVFNWSSSNTAVATVTNNGLVEAVGQGEADILIRNGNMEHKVSVMVGSRMPKQATRFGNGLLVRWDSVNSPLLKKNELKYLDRDGATKIASIDGRLDSAIIADFGSNLEVSSVYFKNDTIRISPRVFIIKNVATTVDFSGSQIDVRHFDIGRGTGWYDSTPKNTLGNDYRSELGDNSCGVDIGADNSLGDITAGEWLIYTLHVKATGTYNLDLNGMVTGDSTIVKFVLDNSTDTLSYAVLGSQNASFSWLTAKGLPPALYITDGLHKLKMIFTDGNLRLKNLRFRPKNAVSGGLLPAVQYLFEFPEDYSKPTIGTKKLVFGDQSNPPQPIDIAGRVVPATDPPVGGVALTIPQNVSVKIPNPTDDTLKKYTMMWDIRIPTQGRWYTLLHTKDNSRNGDAQFFIRNNDNSLGKGGVSNYGGPEKSLSANRWYRVVLCVDANTNQPDSAKYTIYLDGEFYLENSWITHQVNKNYEQMWINRSFSIFSDDNNEDNELDCANFALWADTCLNAVQVAALGKVKYPPAQSLGIIMATRFGNGVIAYYEDNWRVSYYAQYIARNGYNYGYYTSKTESVMFYPYCYTGLRVSEIVNGRIGEPVFYPDSKMTDVSVTIFDTAETIIPIVNFDGGGEGVGYHEDNNNKDGGNNYRLNVLHDIGNSVDVEGSESGDPFNDMNIGYTSAGEWLQYTVYAPKAGRYFFDVYVTVNGGGASYSLLVNSEEMPSVSYINQNSWGAYRWFHEATGTSCRRAISLKQGYNVIRYVMQGGSHNLKGIKFKPIPELLSEPEGVGTATKFANGLAVMFNDIGCVGTYTLNYINTANLAKSIKVSTVSALISDYQSGLTVLAGSREIPFDESTIVDKTRTLSTGGTLDIYAVDFDGGGKGVGYTTNRTGNNDYRAGLGDFNCGLRLAGSGNPDNRHLEGMRSGEWLLYSLNVETAGDYAVDLNIGVNGTGAIYSLTVNGIKTVSYPLANNGDHNSFRWHSTVNSCKPTVRLKKGLNTLRFNVESLELYNLRAIRLEPALPHEPGGLSRAVKFGNGLIVRFLDNQCVNYTLEYLNTSGVASTKSITAETQLPMLIDDYRSGLTAKVTATGTVIPFTNIEDVSGTVTAATGLDEMWMVNVDAGGRNVGYYDQSNGAGNRYRDQYLGDVDNGLSVEGSGTNPANLNISHTGGGEWLQYTVFVETAGAYKFDVKLSVNNGNNNAKYRLVVNGGVSQGGEETPEISLENWGQWQSYRWYHEYYNDTQPNPVINLHAGVNTIRFYVINGNYNIRSWRLQPV